MIITFKYLAFFLKKSLGQKKEKYEGNYKVGELNLYQKNKNLDSH